MAGAAIVALVLAVALLSLLWTPYPPTAIDILHRLASPSSTHPLGTDPYGRDELSMIMAGAWNSLAVAVIAVALGIAGGVPLGLLAAGRGGWIDDAVMRGSDVAFAFPALLTAVMITAIAGPGAVDAMIAIGLFNVPVFARVTRGAARAIWPREFITAARAVGLGDLRITRLHILPNVMPLLIVQGTVQFALAIIADAGLSYVGLGTQPPQPSWGRMLNDAQTYAYQAPWLAIFPGFAIMVSVLGLNLLGDGLRDVLDPRLRR
ncbi:MAG TPA: ABC transporter permease [Acetobacteraceae bacterium]|nr:ABC transporter permease [Acetobacteraceae bacterium]